MSTEIYSARIVRHDQTHQLIITDHNTASEDVIDLPEDAVQQLPQYLAMLRRYL